MAKSKKTKYVGKHVKAYVQQEKRIKRAISKAQKEGYVFDYELPQRPKRITAKAVETLTKITPKFLRTKGYHVEESTGEAISATTYFKGVQAEKRKARARVSAEEFDNAPLKKTQGDEELLNGEDYVIDRMYELLGAPDRESVRYTRRKQRAIVASEQERMIVLTTLHRVIYRDGKAETAHRLARYENKLFTLVDKVLYGYDDVEISGSANELLNIIEGRAMTGEEAKEYADAFESGDTGDYGI